MVPLTAAHLLNGHRLTGLPDPLIQDDDDGDYTSHEDITTSGWTKRESRLCKFTVVTRSL